MASQAEGLRERDEGGGFQRFEEVLDAAFAEAMRPRAGADEGHFQFPAGAHIPDAVAHVDGL